MVNLQVLGRDFSHLKMDKVQIKLRSGQLWHMAMSAGGGLASKTN